MRLDERQLRMLKHKNRLQTALLLSMMLVYVGLLGHWILGGGFVFLAPSLVFLLLWFNPARSPALLLRIYQASEITAWQAPRLHRALQVLAGRAGLRHVPQLHYVPVGTMNAFSAGASDQAVIGLSDGLLRRLTEEEIIGVLAHELSHIRHNDLMIMSVAEMMGTLTRFLSLMGQITIFFSLPLVMAGVVTLDLLPLLLLIFAPLFSALIQLAISRRREILADTAAAGLLGSPQPLIDALVKLDQQGSYWERLYRASSDNALLRTHPTTQERLVLLQSIADVSRDELYADMDRSADPFGSEQLRDAEWLRSSPVKKRRYSRFFLF